MTFPNGSSFHGFWEKGELYGTGKVVDENGSENFVVFENGKPIEAQQYESSNKTSSF